MFNWETFEPDEYSRNPEPSYVDLTTRSYVTAEGHATKHTDDSNFLRLAGAAAEVAQTISGGPDKGIRLKASKHTGHTRCRRSGRKPVMVKILRFGLSNRFSLTKRTLMLP